MSNIYHFINDFSFCQKDRTIVLWQLLSGQQILLFNVVPQNGKLFQMRQLTFLHKVYYHYFIHLTGKVFMLKYWFLSQKCQKLVFRCSLFSTCQLLCRISNFVENVVIAEHPSVMFALKQEYLTFR